MAVAPKSGLTLDDVTRDPGRARALPRSVRADLVAQCAALILVLTSAEDSAEVKPQPRVTGEARELDGQMLTPAEAALLLRRSVRWIYRHADRLPFVKCISRKSMLCSKSGIEKWLAVKPASWYASAHENHKAGGTHGQGNGQVV